MNPVRPEPHTESRIPAIAGIRPGSLLAVLGGKGGVGKTNIATNIAVAAASMDAQVLLVDGDLGLANVDVLLGLEPRWNAADVLAERCHLQDAILPGPGGLHVLAAATARLDLCATRPVELTGLLAPLLSAGFRYDLVVVDVGAGIGPTVLSLAGICDRAWIVTTPEPTSLTDAYATLKVLSRTASDLTAELIVNAAKDASQARATHAHLEQVSLRFLQRALPLRGWVPRDARIEDAVAARRAVVQAFPTAASSRSLIRLASELLSGSGSIPTDSWRRIEA